MEAYRKCSKCGQVYAIEEFIVPHRLYGTRLTKRCSHCRTHTKVTGLGSGIELPQEVILSKLLNCLKENGNVFMHKNRIENLGEAFFESWYNENCIELRAKGYKRKFNFKKCDNGFVITMDRFN